MARKSVESLLTPYAQQLGKVPDQDIADKAGVSRAVTVAYRKKLGIPAYDGHRHRGKEAAAPAPAPAEEPKAAPKVERVKAPKAEPKAQPVAKVEEKPAADGSFRGRKSALDKFIHLLGTRPDAEVAALANVTPENVRTYRTRRGIPSTWRQADAAPPAPAPVVKAPKPAKSAAVAVAPTPATQAEVVPAPAPAEAPKAPEVVIVSEPVASAPVAAAPVVEAAPASEPVQVPAPLVPVVTPAPVADHAMVAFQVILESEGTTLRYVVVGTDIAAAAGTTLAGLARRHPGYDVRSIERIADVLA